MRVLFIGTGEIGGPTLRALQNSPHHQLIGLVTQPDKPAGRDQRILPPPAKIVALNSQPDLPVFQPARIKAPEAIAELNELKPDVMAVMAYGQILPRAVLAIPRIACLNLHASILPRWRGAAPIQAAITAGDGKTGITVMYMNEGLDTGDILLIREITIAHDETGGSLHDRLGRIAPDALLESLTLLGQGKAPRIPQEESRATSAPKLSREAGLIDWTQPAATIERMVRAFDPWPGAYTLIRTSDGRTRKLKIFSGTIDDGQRPPGEIMRQNDKSLTIGTGEKSFVLQTVQLEGRQRMGVPEFLRGHREFHLA